MKLLFSDIQVVSKIENLTQTLFTYFAQYRVKANSSKCHILLSATNALFFQISEAVVCRSHSKKLLGSFFDYSDFLHGNRTNMHANESIFQFSI